MGQALLWAAGGTGFTFLMTALGAAMVAYGAWRVAADERRVRIHKAYDFDAQFVPELEYLSCQRDGRLAGADEQQPFARPHSSAEPLEDHSPADHECDDEQGGDHEHATPEN